MIIHLACEDILSIAVAKNIIKIYFSDIDLDFIEINCKGRENIRTKINSYNKISSDLLFFILVDLDADNCAPEIINNWLKYPFRKNLIFRIAVREIESWILADTKGFASFLNLEHDYIKKEIQNPDDIMNPKEKLLKLVDKSRKKDLKADMVRKYNNVYKQGPAYNSQLMKYLKNDWNIDRARKKSGSLEKAIRSLSNF